MYFCIFFSTSNRYSFYQTVKTPIRCRVLNWVCTFCQCHKNGMLGLYRLTDNFLKFIEIIPALRTGRKSQIGNDINSNY